MICILLPSFFQQIFRELLLHTGHLVLKVTLWVWRWWPKRVQRSCQQKVIWTKRRGDCDLIRSQWCGNQGNQWVSMFHRSGSNDAEPNIFLHLQPSRDSREDKEKGLFCRRYLSFFGWSISTSCSQQSPPAPQ